MMPYQKNSKNNPNFFPHFFLVYEKKTMLKKKDKIKKNLSIIIIIMKIINILYLCFKKILNMIYQIFKLLFCYRFMFKYVEMNLKNHLKKKL
jgi:hypothetical protein